LQTDGTFNYTYDSEGNTTRRTRILSGKVTDYTWDHRNRLTSVTDRVSGTGVKTQQVEYIYDAFNQLTGERVATQFDGLGNVSNWSRYEVFAWADGQEDGQGLQPAQDPIGFNAGDANLYRYVGNHPTMIGDPSGLEEPATSPVGKTPPTRSAQEWDEWQRKNNNRIFLEKSLEHSRRRERGGWGYRIQSLPVEDLLASEYLVNLMWQDLRDWRSGDPSTFALRPDDSEYDNCRCRCVGRTAKFL